LQVQKAYHRVVHFSTVFVPSALAELLAIGSVKGLQKSGELHAMHQAYGSSGVQDVLNLAVTETQPLLVYCVMGPLTAAPVHLQTENVLCLVCRPGCTPVFPTPPHFSCGILSLMLLLFFSLQLDVYTILLHTRDSAGEVALNGDFIRCEAVLADGSR
jgi:hypothetical protein